MSWTSRYLKASKKKSTTWDVPAWKLTQKKRKPSPFLSIYDEDELLDPDNLFNNKDNEISQEGLKSKELSGWD